MNTFLTEASSNKGIRLAGVAVLSLLALFLLAITIDTVAGYGKNEMYPSKTVTVVGEGQATVIPDVARVTFTVQEIAADVASAQMAATERTDNALNALGEQGVEESDMKTLSYNVWPQYEQQVCASGVCPIPPARVRIISAENISRLRVNSIGASVPENRRRSGRDTPAYASGSVLITAPRCSFPTFMEVCSTSRHVSEGFAL